VLSWPASATGYSVQSTASLTGTWADMSPQPPVTVQGTQNTATIAIGTGSQFYRLRK
jgi:hypothetical protein